MEGGRSEGPQVCQYASSWNAKRKEERACNSGVGLKDDNCSHCTWHEDVWGWGVRSLMVVFKMFRFPRWNFTESWYISEV